MTEQRRQNDDIETIGPDLAFDGEQAIDPAELVKRERDKYGDDSSSPNRDDQWDEHHGDSDDTP